MHAFFGGEVLMFSYMTNYLMKIGTSIGYEMVYSPTLVLLG